LATIRDRVLGVKPHSAAIFIISVAALAAANVLTLGSVRASASARCHRAKGGAVRGERLHIGGGDVPAAQRRQQPAPLVGCDPIVGDARRHWRIRFERGMARLAIIERHVFPRLRAVPQMRCEALWSTAHDCPPMPRDYSAASRRR
jgi:hypothetical protein